MYQYLSLTFPCRTSLWILHIKKWLLIMLMHTCTSNLTFLLDIITDISWIFNNTTCPSLRRIRFTQICRKTTIGFVCENEHRWLIKMSIRNNHYRHLRTKLSSHRNPFRLMLNKKWSHSCVGKNIWGQIMRVYTCSRCERKRPSLSDEDERCWCWDDTLIYLHENFPVIKVIKIV